MSFGTGIGDAVAGFLGLVALACVVLGVVLCHVGSWLWHHIDVSVVLR